MVPDVALVLDNAAATAFGLAVSPRSTGTSLSLRAYLELLRPPNLVTAGADVVAGSAVAGFGNAATIPWLVLASVCLYGGGVVLNDFFDRELDKRERPERPIPSGRVSPTAGALFGISISALGIVVALVVNPIAGALAGTIAVSTYVYDAWGKRSAILGPVNMGLCRGLNLLLGVAAVPAILESAWAVAFLPFVYITGVTALSRGEVTGGDRRTVLFSLITLVLVLTGLLFLTPGPSVFSFAAWPLAAVLGWRTIPAMWRAYRDPEPDIIRSAVKAGILSIVILDAALVASYEGLLFGCLVLAVAILAGSLARRFAVT